MAFSVSMVLDHGRTPNFEGGVIELKLGAAKQFHLFTHDYTLVLSKQLLLLPFYTMRGFTLDTLFWRAPTPLFSTPGPGAAL